MKRLGFDDDEELGSAWSRTKSDSLGEQDLGRGDIIPIDVIVVTREIDRSELQDRARIGSTILPSDIESDGSCR